MTSALQHAHTMTIKAKCRSHTSLWIVIWCTHPPLFFSSLWSTMCLMRGSKPHFLPDNKSLSYFSFFSPPLTPLLQVLSSKYRQRSWILHLSVSHSHTNSQVYAGVMQHFACAWQKIAHSLKSRSKQNKDSEQKTQPRKISFKLKGPVDH